MIYVFLMDIHSVIIFKVFHQFSFFWRNFFLGGQIINIVALRNFKVCMSVCGNICFDYKSRKNWCNAINFGYVFDVNYLLWNTKIRDCIFDTFYKVHIKSFLNFVQPSLINECTNIPKLLIVKKVTFSWSYYCS